MATREEQEYSSQAPAGYVGDFLQQGIFPYAQQFLRDQFSNLGQADSSPFTYTGPRVAQFDPRERYAMNLADSAIGSYRPYLGAQAGLLDEASGLTRRATGRGTDEISRGLTTGRQLSGQASDITRGATFDQSGRADIQNAQFTQPGLADFRSALPSFNEATAMTRAGAPNLDLARFETASARPDFRGARTGLAGSAAELAGARPDYGEARGALGRAEMSGYGSTRAFNPSNVSSFYNPFEDAVVEQTLADVREGLAKGDMGLRDEAVSSGAFGGARSRMRRGELAENTARGAAEAVAGIRSGGFEGARNAAQQAFESQQARQAGLAGLQSGLAGIEGGFSGQQAQTALGRAQQLGSLAGQEAGFAEQEGSAALARGRQFGDLSTTEAQNTLARAAQLGSFEAQQAQAKLARGEALNQSEMNAINVAMQRGQALNQLDQQAFQNQMQRGQQLGALGQQQFNMGLQGGQGIAGLGQQAAQGLGALGQQYSGMASLLPQLQQNDINQQLALGGLGRGRQQSLMDLNYQNFVGQYNLPMQTLQNVGSLTAALGPLAGGYGYAGAAPASNSNYYPNIGTIPNPYLPPIDNTTPPGTTPPGTTPPGTTPPGTTPPGTTPPGTTPPGTTPPGGPYVPFDPTAPVQQFAGGGGIGLPGLYNRYRR